VGRRTPIAIIKLLVADHYILRRQSLVCLLRTHPEFEVVGELSECSEFMETLNNSSIDIVISDLNLPSINNLDPVSFFLRRNSNLRVLILSDNLSPMSAIKSFRNGAIGYVVRMEDIDSLIKGILSVYRGKRYISGLINDQILDAVISGKTFEDGGDDRISSREKEILNLIDEGRTNSEIGKLLVISTRTVETHRNNIMRKLGFSSQIDIIRYAFKHGLITLE